MKYEWEKMNSGWTHNLEDIPKGANIISVDDVECIGRCESCMKPLTEYHEYFSDPEGVLICDDCMGKG